MGYPQKALRAAGVLEGSAQVQGPGQVPTSVFFRLPRRKASCFFSAAPPTPRCRPLYHTCDTCTQHTHTHTHANAPTHGCASTTWGMQGDAVVHQTHLEREARNNGVRNGPGLKCASGESGYAGRTDPGTTATAPPGDRGILTGRGWGWGWMGRGLTLESRVLGFKSQLLDLGQGTEALWASAIKRKG